MTPLGPLLVMIFRFAPLFLLPLLLLSAPAHAVVTVLVEEVDNGEGGTDVVATATGSIDVSGFTGGSSSDGEIDLEDGTLIVGPKEGDIFSLEAVTYDTPTSGTIWDNSTATSVVNPTTSEYKGKADSSFFDNSSSGSYQIALGVKGSTVLLSENLISLVTTTDDMGTLRSTWANQSFPDLGIAYNSTWTIEWDGGGENKTLTYTAVPEPSQYGLLFGLAAAFAAVGLRRRRRAGGNS